MALRDGDRIAKPTITEVLERFLEEQRQRLAPRTFSKYKDIVELLKHSLNNYAYQYLDRSDSKLFDRLYGAKGDAHREFCDIFGPEHILSNVDEFLGYFMVRKVIAGKEILRAAGTVTKKLAKWMLARGYAEAEAVEDATEQGAAAARNLPKAEDLATHLNRFADEQGWGVAEEEVEDRFLLTRVEPGKVWLEGIIDGRTLGPIEVPKDISRDCEVGWRISGVVGLFGKRWRLLDAWNVYPL